MLGNCGTERLWELINSGELESYLDGRARRITVASIKAHIARKLAAQSPQPRRRGGITSSSAEAQLGANSGQPK
jgi:hypothetical protein